MSVVIDWHGCNLYIGGYAGVRCRSLIEVTPKNQEKAIKLFRHSLEDNNFEIDGLFLNGKDLGDLSWLREFPNLRNLYIDSRGQKLKDISEIHRLTNLRKFGMADSIFGQLDFCLFPDLTSYSGAWSNSFKNLGKCISLDELYLNNYSPVGEDLDELKNLYKLRTLSLYKPKLISLLGIRGLEDLYYLGLYSASNLKTLDEFEKLDSLRSLDIEKCRNISNIEALAKAPKLRELKLSDFGEIKSIRFISKMNSLEFISFVGTRIKDGDLSVLVEHPRLKYAGFFNAKHYSHSSEKITEILKSKKI